MKVGIMQPYFFPYIGYFALIEKSDFFILLDEVQFIRHGWIERNRILKQSGGWNYISVPLEKHSRDTLIRDIRIRNTEKWKEKILSQLVYYKGAPNYYKIRKLVEAAIYPDYEGIVQCNCQTLRMVCEYLGISTPIEVFSEMNLEIESPGSADEWALNICRALPGVTEYWNPEGGAEFFDKAKYEKYGLELYFMKMQLREYEQKGNEFIPGLSILDVMMFNSPEEIHGMMKEFVLCEGNMHEKDTHSS